MIISHRHRFIFFNNPLTGSDAIRRYLDAWSEEPVVDFSARMPDQPFHHYMCPEEAEYTFNVHGWNFNNYARITCVRNPYTRLPALYDRIKSTDPIWRVRKTLKLSLPSFETWFSSAFSEGKEKSKYPSQIWRQYGIWTAVEWCADRITHVVPIEQVDRLLPPILRELEIPRPEDPKELLAKQTLTQPLSKTAIKMIGSQYAMDISAFGYAPTQNQKAA